MKTKFTRISSVLLAMMLLVALVPMQAIALYNGGSGGSAAGELQFICLSGEHSWNAGEVTTAATCTSTGVRTFTCALCGATKTEDIAKTAHTPGELVSGTPATCTEGGTIDHYVCQSCGIDIDADGQPISAAVPATGHTLVPTDAVAETCTTPGNTAYWTCSECGKYFSDENGETEIAADSWIVPEAGHTWVAWQEGDDIADFTLKTEATTESAAVYYKNCSVDGTSAQGIDEDATFTYGDPLPDEPDIMYGDADGDGEITSADVILLNQYFADVVTAEELEAGADVDGDGEVTSADVILLNQYFADVVTIDDLGPQS